MDLTRAKLEPILAVALTAMVSLAWHLHARTGRAQMTFNGYGSKVQSAEWADLKQGEAMAFIVGWNSKILLLPDVAHKEALATTTKAYLEVLGVHLEHNVEYYLSDPTKDNGIRAQEFAERVYRQLLAGNRGIANHFGIATNIVLIIARCECEGNVPEAVVRELDQLVQHLDLPMRFQLVPRTKLTQWASGIERYFESVVKATWVIT